MRPVGVREAIRRAIVSEEQLFTTTRWSDAMSSTGPVPKWGGVQFGTRLIDSRTLRVGTTPSRAFATIQQIGGETGWYAWNWLWHARGYLDLLAGGVGMRRGRRSPTNLRVGDTVDFWRVEVIEPERRLRLVAEMKLPGRAWLEFEVQGEGSSSTIRQTAMLRSRRVTRPRLLVPAVSLPRAGVRWNAEGDSAGGGSDCHYLMRSYVANVTAVVFPVLSARM